MKKKEMNSKVYKWCAVPLCKNTSITARNKLFVYVPKKKVMREKWLKLARRDPTDVVTNSSIYFCEDHFDLPNDMHNYMEYHLMGSVSQVRMKPGCIPKKFSCQPDREAILSDTVERLKSKKRKKMALEESEKHLEQSCVVTEQLNTEEISYGNSVQHDLQQETSKISNKAIQVNTTKTFRSKGNQTEVKLTHQATSPSNLHCVYTSAFKINHSSNTSRPRGCILRGRIQQKEHSDSDTSYTPSVTRTESSSSIKSLQVEPTSNCSEIVEDDEKQESLRILQFTLKKITKNPRSYIGVPLSCYYLINLIQEQTNIPSNHILLCLKKIRLNNSFCELADEFAMDKTYASKIFFKSIPLLASVIRPLIVKLDEKMIKRNLTMAFRHKYSTVSCIIDCVEIELEKPFKALNEPLSRSDSKKANTIKYLVSCTPNGLVNYVSNGYGGEITDTCLVESCDFIKGLHPSMCVMADKGFKHVEVFLSHMGVLFVRPPKIVSEAKLSKIEAMETKQIARLRMQIKRVIKLLREFNMLKPHACLNFNLSKVLDDVITIACGLINLQDSVIK